MKLLGFEFNKQQKTSQLSKSPVRPQDDAEVSTISAAGYFGHYVDIDGTLAKNTSELILRYRQIAEQPECDSAVSKIVNEAIATSEVAAPVSLRISDATLSESMKDKIYAEFNKVLSLLDFNSHCADIFRQWFIDGKMYYHIIIDENDPKKGIAELRSVDPINIRKIREVNRETDRLTGVEHETTVAEYYLYSDKMVDGTYATVFSGSAVSGVKVSVDAIVYVPSGLLDSSRKNYISYLHKAIKPTNQLRMLEDAMVIYRYSRAPERRIFYIDTGDMPSRKAEEYVRSVMANYKNKLVYDASSGEISDDRRHMSMLEDFWLPRKNGGQGTEITTLPGGDGMDQTDHLNFFKKKLYSSLNVPTSRLDSTSTFSFGRVSEISREEIEFQRFIDAMRRKFSQLFLELLRTQLLLRRIISRKDWERLKEKLSVDYLKDNYFTELKEIELLKERIQTADAIQTYIGKYFSRDFVRRTVFRLTDDEIKKMNTEIDQEKTEDSDSKKKKKDEQPADQPEPAPAEPEMSDAEAAAEEDALTQDAVDSAETTEPEALEVEEVPLDEPADEPSVEPEGVDALGTEPKQI